MEAKHRTTSLSLSLMLSVLAAPAFAQGDGDPPSRVARLNLMQGTVSMQPAGADEWVPGIINRPFTTGDYLFADNGSRAELHLDTAVIRMNEQTSFGFLNLGDQVAQLQLSEGEMQIHLRRLGDDDTFEVDTPNAAVTLLREGDYAFTVNPNNGTTFLVIRHGSAEVTGGGQAFTLRANQSVQLSGTDTLGYDVENAPGPDDFENYCVQRDQREAHLQSTRYVPADMIGYEDLDDNGSWRSTPDYGNVWYPRNVPADWAPYHNGHWAWVDPWGWTWVDDMPWGFAPFHYGRWAYVGGAWGWTPGPTAVVVVGRPVVRPVYAPALVAFIGGSTWGVSVGFGGGPRMGWVPLGPGELYSPAYHVSPNYYNHVNVANTTINKNVNITNVYNTTYVNKTVVNNTTIINNNQRYVNMQAPNAVMTMPQTAFASGQTASKVGAPVQRQDVAKIQMSSAVVAPPVAPTRQSLTAGYTATQKQVPHPPAQVLSRPVVAKVAPPPAPVSFAAQQQVLQKNAGQVFNAKAVQTAVGPAAAKPPVNQVKIANQGQTVVKTNVGPGQKVGPVATNPNAGRPAVANTPNAVVSKPPTAAANPANPAPNNPANLHGVPPNRQPTALDRPANPPPNPNAAQPAVKTNNPNAVVNQPNTPAPNNPANLHGVPPNRQPNASDRPANPPVSPNTAQPVKTPPPPPAPVKATPAPTQTEAYKPPPQPVKQPPPPPRTEAYKPPPPPPRTEAARPPAQEAKPAPQPPAHAQAQTTKPTHKPTKEEEDRKKTEH
jgi:FecR protein